MVSIDNNVGTGDKWDPTIRWPEAAPSRVPGLVLHPAVEGGQEDQNARGGLVQGHDITMATDTFSCCDIETLKSLPIPDLTRGSWGAPTSGDHGW